MQFLAKKYKDCELVWVYGASAAGKETLISQIISQKPPYILKKFNWNDKNLIACKESIEWVRLRYGDGQAEKRIKLPKIILKLLKKNEVVIIKGQDIDLENNSLNKLFKMLPHSKHRIIFLHAPLRDIYKRCQKKVWWDKDAYNLKIMKSWLTYQINLILKLNKKIQITALRNFQGQYRLTNFPPKLKGIK